MKNIQSEQLLTDATNAPTKHHVEHDACKMTREFLCRLFLVVGVVFASKKALPKHITRSI